jgi:desulfoferrodoxin-like iron-binding protein
MNQYYECEYCHRVLKAVEPGKGNVTCCGTPMKLISQFQSTDSVLDFAIKKEEAAAQFYKEWAKKIENSWIRDVFNDFAKEEEKHKSLLEETKKGNKLKSSEKKITDMRIADYLVDLTPSPDMDYQHALIVAMKREKASFRLYTDLARATEDENVREVFQVLAQEEAKHKLRLETLYDKEVLIWD